MKCNEVKRLLSAYFDKELSEDKLLRIKEHLRYCSSCSSELKKIEKVHKLMEAFPVLEVGPYFESQIIERIDEESKKSKKRFSLGLKFAISFALGGLLILLITFKYLPSQNEPIKPYPSLNTYLEEYIESTGRHIAKNDPGLIKTVSVIGDPAK